MTSQALGVLHFSHSGSGVLGAQPFTASDLSSVAHGTAKLSLADAARDRVQRGRAVVERIAASEKAAYGINTGFGGLAEVRIPNDRLAELQRRLLLSHAAGVGEPLSVPETRALMALRALVLSTGTAGVRPLVLDQLLAVLNAGITPIVPEKGSVGASGDLAPLAHLALTLIGEGEALLEGQHLPAALALKQVGLTPITLAAKEGLALVNGTQAMSAVGGLALCEAQQLTEIADILGALTVEAMLGSHRPFDERIHQARPHRGQIESAAHLRQLLAGGDIAASHIGCHKVQDAYSLRCMPQVHGATRDTLRYCLGVLETEMNSATDNPLVFAPGLGYGEEELVISGGNFHGQPIALALDFAAIAIAEIANISERRIEQLLNPTLSGLPAFLSEAPGENSGYMMAQVTAAALVNENKVLCHPASVDSIPGSASREDHVSMGMTSARKLREVVRNVRHVLAIEWMCAVQALEFRLPLQPGPALQKASSQLRIGVPRLAEDRLLAKDLAWASKHLLSLAA